MRRTDMRRLWLPEGAVTLTGIVAAVAVLVLLQTLGHAREPASAPEQAVPSPAFGGAASPGWQTIFTETFENGIGPGWIVTDTSGTDEGNYVWGTSTFTYVSEGVSAWCAGGGAKAGDLYTDGMDSWLVSEPIELGGAHRLLWDAEVRFAWWLDTVYLAKERRHISGTYSVRGVDSPPRSGDWFGWGILTDVSGLHNGSVPDGDWSYMSGATAGWARSSLPLDAFVPAGRALTSSVRIAFRFLSDDDGAVGRGAFVDDVDLRVNYGYEVALPLMLREPPVTPTPTPSPTPPSTQESLLLNGSFEDGWYDVVIGQVPREWVWHWVDGETLPGSDDPAVAPETRVLPQAQVPPDERDTFFLEGIYCVKVFKGGAPMYAALSQEVRDLEVGRNYRLTAPIYVDVFNWEDGKVPPTDPWAAQVRLGAAPTDAAWRDEEAISYGTWWSGDNTDDFYLSYNDFTFEFTATDSQMTVYVEVYGKWGLDNNGFFMDDLQLMATP